MREKKGKKKEKKKEKTRRKRRKKKAGEAAIAAGHMQALAARAIPPRYGGGWGLEGR